jgi:hypothetical protein
MSHTFATSQLSRNIHDLLADQGRFELAVRFWKYLFEMSGKFPLMCRETAN